MQYTTANNYVKELRTDSNYPIVLGLIKLRSGVFDNSDKAK